MAEQVELDAWHTPTFKGRDRPEECEALLLRVEKILESMVCLEENWVRLTSFCLRATPINGGEP